MIIYLPKGLDLNSHIQNFPVTGIIGFEKDKLAYILSLLISIPANNKEIAKEGNGWVPISSAVLANKVKNYREYLDYGLGHGRKEKDAALIFTDNRYIVGVKSKAYRFNSLCINEGIEPYILTNITLIKNLEREQKKRRRKVAQQYPNLVKWFNQSLRIDGDKAREYVGKLKDEAKAKYDKEIFEILDGTLDKKLHELKDSEAPYLSALENITRIEEGNFFLSVDDNVRRFHSNLTNLKSELRNFITYDNQPLVSIDIKNSQPFLSTVLFNHKFYRGPKLTSEFLEEYEKRAELSVNRETNAFIISKVAFSIYRELADSNYTVKVQKPKNGYKDISLLDSLIMFSKSMQSADSKDVEEYIIGVTNGVFYERLAVELKERLQVIMEERKDIKKLVFQVLFTNNRFFAQKEARPKRLFAALYPTVYELFNLIKRRDSSTLPRLLQSVESWLILDQVCREINRSYSSLPIFTIHDSILTVRGYEKHVKGYMEEIISKYVGYKPEFDITYYDPSSLK